MKRVIVTPKMRTVDQNKFVITVSSIVSPAPQQVLCRLEHKQQSYSILYQTTWILGVSPWQPQAATVLFAVAWLVREGLKSQLSKSQTNLRQGDSSRQGHGGGHRATLGVEEVGGHPLWSVTLPRHHLTGKGQLADIGGWQMYAGWHLSRRRHHHGR